ncbi:glycerol-3-phosphate dehydrogenase/oxidase [Spelaeicoccus albus]|uniref:Glycerol-3-phosphate dehydrogenase n=1 Tax=Spelaeicoccus albus TaxID=1280376 RepID=A0A7Z0CZ76_9MICO|nr:glycerol-3-phosphate dehydrogenase/oxidase [Spelaeicoccus albus]NYI65994.1 glycerol-3-phosphate dehydrogenase [Spelaeicoccus albus]
MKAAALSQSSRLEAVEALGSREFDVLVIGGGVTGAGTALDAASRGLSVALVEARDYASGTSSRASKLIHGGLRYLQMLDFKLVREALTERGRLLTAIAPHLVQPVPFIYPFTHKVWERGYIGAGLMLYDGLSFAPGVHRGVPLHRHLSRRSMQKLFPEMREDAAVGGLRYYDAKVDDARFVATLIRTATSHGAVTASRMQATEYLTDHGHITGVVADDLESGQTVQIRARHVISATGVWTEATENLPGFPASPDAGASTSPTSRGLKVRASKGIHIVVPGDRIVGNAGMILNTEKSVLFIIPWDGYWVIGTTDTDWQLPKAHPVANATDIDYLLDHVNAVLKNPLTRDDVIGTYSGLRPLLQPVSTDAQSTAKVSREHTAATPAPGLTAIAGGKFTTYRVMAEDVVDQALGPEAKGNPSITANLPMLGAEGFKVRMRQRGRIAAKYGWEIGRVNHLLRRYGGLIDEILELIDADPSLGEPLPGAEQYLKAEVTYAVTHEGALHLEDVLTRRTRLSYEQPERGLAASDTIADLMGRELGWSDQERNDEIAAYRARVDAERAAELEPDDESAAAVRARAEEIMPPEGSSLA